MAFTTSILVVHPALPVKTVKELLALARAKPGQLNYSAGTTGATAHLGAELLKTMAGVHIVHIPYKGGAAQLTALLTGEVQLSFTTMPATLPHIRSGRLRPIAVASIARSPVLPEIPTVAESGLPGFDVRAWNGILAPGKTPPTIVTRLNKEIVGIINEAEVNKRLSGAGADPVNTTPEEFSAYIKAEVAKWQKIVKFAGIKVD